MKSRAPNLFGYAGYFHRRDADDGNGMNPDVFPENANTIVDKERDGGSSSNGSATGDEADEVAGQKGRGAEIVETKVVGKDESTRLA
jgi:hypothetical protein